MNPDTLSLIQNHTRQIYHLDGKKYTVEKIPARQLLHITRFDLFAKLFYIRHRHTDSVLARKVYSEHIRAFNPDLKEPGREDKSGLEQFIATFDSLIDQFATSEFDASVSVVPVDENGIILDGAHRVAVLAFYDKEVTVARFEGVVSKGLFNYRYFITRGLPIETADMIALEATRWCKNLYAACIWPKINSSKGRQLIKDILKSQNEILYEKNLLVSLNPLTRFMAYVYSHQDWIGNEANHFAGARAKASNCYSLGGHFDIVFFQSDKPLEQIISMKEEIRSRFNYGKHSVHITDNDAETLSVSEFVLDRRQRGTWLRESDWLSRNSIHEKCREWGMVFKYCYYLRFKELVYRILHHRFFALPF